MVSKEVALFYFGSYLDFERSIENKSHMRLTSYYWSLHWLPNPMMSGSITERQRGKSHTAFALSWWSQTRKHQPQGPLGNTSNCGWWVPRGRGVGLSFTPSLPHDLFSVPVMWDILNLFHFDPLIQHLVPRRMLISFLWDRRCVGARCISRAFKMT